MVAVMVALGPVVDAAPSARVPPLPSLREMTRIAAEDRAPLAARCFGYAARTHLFACVGHDPIYNTDHIGADDQATNIRIDVVGPSRSRSWTIAAIGSRATTPRAKVEKALSALGMRPLTTSPVAITANRWTSVGAAQLFLRVDLHEGDASFENFGDLSVRCADAKEIVIDLRAAGIELGEAAVAFPSPDGAWLAISIAGLDGGEGTYDYTLDTVVLDLATTCARGAPASWTSRPAAEGSGVRSAP